MACGPVSTTLEDKIRLASSVDGLTGRRYCERHHPYEELKLGITKQAVLSKMELELSTIPVGGAATKVNRFP
jgi:hypothetical protein